MAGSYFECWNCACCSELMPEWKRIDGKHRKTAARKRREFKIGRAPKAPNY